MPSFYIEQRGLDRILHNKYGIFSKIELESQMRDGNLTPIELGFIYNLNSSRINLILRALGITYRNSVQQSRTNCSELSASQHQVILGTLMGDAYMKNTDYYEVTHSINQMEYLYHIAEKLDNFSSTITYKYDGIYRSIGIRTFSHDIFNKYYELFYSKGSHKKYFTQASIEDLSEEGLAYWYMDDGKYGEYSAYLCVGSISDLEGRLLVDFLKNRFSLNTTFQVHDKKKEYHNIYIKSESREHFFNMIKPYIIPSMEYKVIGLPYPKICGDEKEIIVKRHLICCSKLSRHLKFYGNKNIKKEIDSNCILLDKKDIYIDTIRKLIEGKKLISHTSFRRPPTNEELIDMLNKGMTDQQVASKFNIGRNRVSDIRKSLGIGRKSSRKNNVDFVCMGVKLVPIDKVQENRYNPNKVASPEIALLIQSIEEDGVTQPIVVYYDSEKDCYIVIDGFHRYTVLKDHFKCFKIPVVVLDKPIKERMASTIRHNRARGKHLVELMGSLVNELYLQGWNDIEIAKHLGMEGEELLRLRQQIGCANFLATQQYSNAWGVTCQEK